MINADNIRFISTKFYMYISIYFNEKLIYIRTLRKESVLEAISQLICLN